MDNLIQSYNLAGEQQRCLYKSGTIWRCNLKYVTGGWLTYPSEKILVSWHYYSQYMEKEKMFQTTNQINIANRDHLVMYYGWKTNNFETTNTLYSFVNKASISQAKAGGVDRSSLVSTTSSWNFGVIRGESSTAKLHNLGCSREVAAHPLGRSRKSEA